jgi:hypothetical protein
MEENFKTNREKNKNKENNLFIQEKFKYFCVFSFLESFDRTTTLSTTV